MRYVLLACSILSIYLLTTRVKDVLGHKILIVSNNSLADASVIQIGNFTYYLAWAAAIALLLGSIYLLARKNV